MLAHHINSDGIIVATLHVDSLNLFNTLIDASVGGEIGDTWNGTAIVKKPRDLVSEKSTFILQVKAEAGAFTAQVLSGLSSEYEMAEKEAMAYKAAGYPDATIPSSILAEIKSKAAKGVTITATVACENILVAATGWRNAQAALRNSRLEAASSAEVAVDTDALDAIKTQWHGFISDMKRSLAYEGNITPEKYNIEVATNNSDY